MPENFLDVLRKRGVDGPLPPPGRGGPAGQAVRPGGERRTWDFAFATGIECSNPRIINFDGRPLRRDLLEECGHYRHFRTDLGLVKELGTQVLRYGLPNHLVHLGPGRYDWSFRDEALAEINRLGITPILDLMHFGVPDWMGDFQNPEMPPLFAEYAGAVAERYPWVRGYTPVNEVYVSARKSGWDGRWNERLRTERGFVTARKHLAAANLLAGAAIVRHRPNAVIVTSESAEYTHHVTVSPSHDVKLHNKLIFLSLDLLYSKSPDADAGWGAACGACAGDVADCSAVPMRSRCPHSCSSVRPAASPQPRVRATVSRLRHRWTGTIPSRTWPARELATSPRLPRHPADADSTACSRRAARISGSRRGPREAGLAGVGVLSRETVASRVRRFVFTGYGSFLPGISNRPAAGAAIDLPRAAGRWVSRARVRRRSTGGRGAFGLPRGHRYARPVLEDLVTAARLAVHPDQVVVRVAAGHLTGEERADGRAGLDLDVVGEAADGVVQVEDFHVRLRPFVWVGGDGVGVDMELERNWTRDDDPRERMVPALAWAPPFFRVIESRWRRA